MIPSLLGKVETEFTRVNCATLRETLLTRCFRAWGAGRCFAFSQGSGAPSAFLESHERPECARSETVLVVCAPAAARVVPYFGSRPDLRVV